MKKIYLAIPYSNVDKELSFKVANIIAARLMNKGFIVFSPISHSHSIAEHCGLPTSWEFWKTQDKAFIEWCDEVHVIILGKDGFNYIDNSKGVQGEIQVANKFHKPIKYIEWKTE